MVVGVDCNGGGVAATFVGIIVAVVWGATGAGGSVSTSEICIRTSRSQVSSMTRRATDSASVAVSSQSLLITAQSIAYWHQ